MPITKAPSSSGFSQLATATLGGAATSLSTGTFTAKKFLQVFIHVPSKSASAITRLQFNGDTGNNYQSTVSQNGGASTLAGGIAGIDLAGSGNVEEYFCLNIFNKSSVKKFTTGQGAISSNQLEIMGWWANTASQITSITLANSAGANFPSGTEITVFGSD